MLQPRAAELAEPPVRGGVLGAGIAVTEVAGEIEAQPLARQPHRLGHRLGVVAEALGRLGRPQQSRARVAAPQALGLVEGRSQPHRHQRVLQRQPRAVVGVGVPSRSAGHPEPLTQLRQPAVARAVAPPQRPLQLDPQALGPEGLQQPPRHRLGPAGIPALPAPRHRAGAGAAREADQPLRVGRQLGERQRGRQRLARPLALSRPLVRQRHELAEVVPSLRVLDQQGEVRGRPGRASPPSALVHHGQLGPVDGADPDPRAGMGEFHRTADVVVIGQGERLQPQLGRGRGQLGRGGSPVEEGVRGVGVQLGVCRRRSAHARWRNQRPSPGSQKTTTLLPSSSTSSK